MKKNTDTNKVKVARKNAVEKRRDAVKSGPARTPKRFEFKQVTMTIQEFVTWIAHRIEVRPVGQRNDVEDLPRSTSTKITKKQGIIKAILDGKDICEIQLVVRCSENGYWISKEDFKVVESLDGGHRKRSIISYINGDFPAPKGCKMGAGKYFNQLDADELDWFLSAKIRFTIFTNLTDKEIGQQFRQTNNVTELNFAEMMNSYGWIPQLAMVRQLTMEVKKGNKEIKEVLPWFSNAPINAYKNKRMIYLEQTLESVVLHSRESFGTVSELDIIEFIESEMNDKQIESLKNKLTSEYLFYDELASCMKKYTGKKISIKTFHILRLIYWNLYSRSKRFLVNNYEELASVIISNQDNWLTTAKTTMYQDENGDDLDSKLKTVEAAYNSYVKKLNNDVSITQAMEWVGEWLNVDGLEDDSIVTIKSKERVFPKEMVHKKWNDVGRINQVTKEPIAFKDVVGAHIVADAHGERRGGKIEYNNLFITDKYHNENMKQENAKIYAYNWQKENLNK